MCIRDRCIDCGKLIDKRSIRCRVCANSGNRSPFYIHGKAKENWTEREIIKSTSKYKKWREFVFNRYNFTCQFCGKRGGKLIADHIKSFRNYPALRLDINNGRLLCEECHRNTPNYGGRAIYNEGGGVCEFQI